MERYVLRLNGAPVADFASRIQAREAYWDAGCWCSPVPGDVLDLYDSVDLVPVPAEPTC